MSKSNPESCIRFEADQAQIDRCRKEINVKSSEFNSLASVLALAGNEVRLKILYLLDQEQALCPCDLADVLKMSVPAISQHLRKMRDGNLIGSRKEGKTIFYSLNPASLEILSLFNEG
ncbi:MAG: metalloregulator ArsR/SmtB family transcription factor [Owenweeksia sp.]|nr:metalloregulator ArsR/SmtB family transcription factor [Owenweeksia sp.]